MITELWGGDAEATTHKQPLVTGQAVAKCGIRQPPGPPQQWPGMQEPTRGAEVHTSDGQIRTKDTERQRIEKDLQRQRMIAISGRTLKVTTDTLKKPVTSPGRTVIHHESSSVSPPVRVLEHDRPVLPVEKIPEQKTVLIGKRKSAPIKDQTPDTEDQWVNKRVEHEDQFNSPGPDASAPEADSDELKVSVKDTRYRAKDDVFEGKSVVRTAVPSARDSGLIHTRLVQKKSPAGTGDENEEKTPEDNPHGQSQTSEKKRKITTKNDDISWI